MVLYDQILQNLDGQNLNYSKIKNTSDLNCGRKNISVMDPWSRSQFNK